MHRRRLKVEWLEGRALLTSTRFAVIGDYGTDDANEAAVAAMVESWNPDLILTVGDNNYGIGAAETIDQNIGRYYHSFIGDYQGDYGLGAATNRFFPTLGNHDWWYPGLDSIAPYLNYFNLPGDGFASSSDTERYYDFRWGDIHFFALDSCYQEPDGRRFDSIQGQWLYGELARSTARWQIVYFHESAYTSGPDSGDQVDMQWPFADWGADAVLSGHEHMYERLSVDGIPFFISGLGGATPRGLGAIDLYSQFRWVDGQGAMLVTVDGSSMVFEFHSVEAGGTLIDRYVVNPRGLTSARTFYNNSAFDAGGDHLAIATDKRPLFVGQSATFANYTSYDKGFNGLVLEFDGATPPDRLTAADFDFRVGNTDNTGGWLPGPSPTSITVAGASGAGQPHRVYLTWPDGAIKNMWLEVTVKATGVTALEDPVVLYFGNAVGESGNSAVDAVVDFGDVWAPTRAPNQAVAVDDPLDYNRDGRRSAADAVVALTKLDIVPGDLNGDDRFGLRDLILWRSALGGSDSERLRRGDLEGDGQFTLGDLSMAVVNYGQRVDAAMVAGRLRLITPLGNVAAAHAESASAVAHGPPSIRARRSARVAPEVLPVAQAQTTDLVIEHLTARPTRRRLR